MFDDNNLLLDQVIFGIAHPDLCHAGIRDITQDRELVTLLLVRHLKKFGGLVLPPSELARLRQEAHEQVVRVELAAHRPPGHMVYPVWYIFMEKQEKGTIANEFPGKIFRSPTLLMVVVVLCLTVVEGVVEMLVVAEDVVDLLKEFERVLLRRWLGIGKRTLNIFLQYRGFS